MVFVVVVETEPDLSASLFYTHTHPHISWCIAGLTSMCLFRQRSANCSGLMPKLSGGRMMQTNGCEQTEAEKGKQMKYLSLPCFYGLYFVFHNPLALPSHLCGHFVCLYLLLDKKIH